MAHHPRKTVPCGQQAPPLEGASEGHQAVGRVCAEGQQMWAGLRLQEQGHPDTHQRRASKGPPPARTCPGVMPAENEGHQGPHREATRQSAPQKPGTPGRAALALRGWWQAGGRGGSGRTGQTLDGSCPPRPAGTWFSPLGPGPQENHVGAWGASQRAKWVSLGSVTQSSGT